MIARLKYAGCHVYRDPNARERTRHRLNARCEPLRRQGRYERELAGEPTHTAAMTPDQSALAAAYFETARQACRFFRLQNDDEAVSEASWLLCKLVCSPKLPAEPAQAQSWIYVIIRRHLWRMLGRRGAARCKTFTDARLNEPSGDYSAADIFSHDMTPEKTLERERARAAAVREYEAWAEVYKPCNFSSKTYAILKRKRKRLYGDDGRTKADDPKSEA